METIAAAPSGGDRPHRRGHCRRRRRRSTSRAGGPGGGDLHADIEAMFRGHPIVGPKLDRIEWPSDDHARVLLRDFPMEAMPPMVRDKFIDRIRSGMRDSKTRAPGNGPITIELVDAASGRVMETITE